MLADQARRRSRRSKLLRPNLIIIAATAIFSIVVIVMLQARGCSAAVRLEAVADELAVTLDGAPGPSPSGEGPGGSSIEVITTVAEVESIEASGDVRVTMGSPLGFGRLNDAAVRMDAGASGHVRIEHVTLDPDAVVQFIASRSTLTMIVRPKRRWEYDPREAPGVSPPEVRVVVRGFAPAGARLLATPADSERPRIERTLGRGVSGGGRRFTVSATATEERSLQLALTAAEGQIGRPVALELHDLNTRSLSFDSVPRAGGFSRSMIRSGELEFTEIEVDPLVIEYHERLRLGIRRGSIRRLAWVPSVPPESAGGGDGRRVDESGRGLHVVWTGVVTGVLLGEPSYQDQKMPPALMVVAGTKQRLYVLGVVIYGWIFAYSMLRRRVPGADDILQPGGLL